ncbi:MAG: Asp23/Gls24 family envelope stress response protein [Ardenticatenaceae bacterium]|nr:Asp23/Gls24 family envelope stress response protein [Anaerolineales bacterium]MCB8984851.1 Asp23/Gls24 family envelope stress response protein [Ardenticatenaceae bacterium]MCB8988374.1 Asp23/Gls24 family envelope stress response protein [Ardenticatenaceae bacterium]
MSEDRQSMGRIEVAPGVLATIAQYAALRVEGVTKMAAIPADVARLFRREVKQDGVLLEIGEQNQVKIDIYVIMDPQVNIMEASRNIQAAVLEAVDTMVGIPVEAINVHVEDVIYAQE